MKQRRLASTVKRIARIEHVLEDELARHPEDADVIDLGGVASRPLPAAATPGGAVAAGRGGSPGGSPGGGKGGGAGQTPSPARRAKLTPKARRASAIDLEAGVAAPDAAALEEADERSWLVRLCAAISVGCLLTLAGETFETYLPFTILLLVPSSFIYGYVRDAIHSYRVAQTGLIAPPAPPAHPDLSGWLHSTETDFYTFAQERPGQYLAYTLGLGMSLGLLALFWKDITDWLERQRLSSKSKQSKGVSTASSYQRLEEGHEEEGGEAARADEECGGGEEGGGGGGKPPKESSAQEMRLQLSMSIHQIEELELKLKLYRGSPVLIAGVEPALQVQRARRAELEAVLDAGSGAAAQQAAAAAPAKKQKGGRGEIAQLINNTANGFVTVSVYFADIVSDVQVVIMLWDTGNFAWAWMSIFFLVAQFVAIYLRVLPYLSATFGKESYVYLGFLYLGCPIGCLALDVLMFLEPFGLLAVLPLPTWAKTFIPAYKATRVIAEVFIESMPQSLLQSYILVVVMGHVNEGTASASDLAMLGYISALPKSITISMLSTLKTWFELVDGSRKAGISIKTKAWQLWNVGGGLPLDAFKKGAIVEWACAYQLDEGEISPLLNALEDNSSLVRLNLASSGLGWSREDSSGAPLVAAMASNPAALGGLQIFIVSARSHCEIPIDQIRMGGGPALRALARMPGFFTLPGGPWHEEILLMGDLLRRNRLATLVTDAERKAGERAQRLLEDARNGQLGRGSWELRVKQLLVEGHTRRAMLASLIGVEVLRRVGFGARELHEGGLSLAALRAGEYTVAELKSELGVLVATLHGLGYAPREMREGGVSAGEIKPFGYSAGEMRANSFTASELKEAAFTLHEMHDAGYSASELKQAAFSATQLRKAGFSAAQCRKAEFTEKDMRGAGFSASEMRTGGYSAPKVRLAGYDATEATAAFGLRDLRDAGYAARELREAGHAVPEMSSVGFTLEELYGGGYPVDSLQAAGYTYAELKAVGTSLAMMKASGASVQQLKAAGYTAARLKTAEYSALRLMEGGFSVGDLEKAGIDPRLIKELQAGKKSAEALHASNFTAKELKAAGFAASELKGGYTAKELKTAGYNEEDLRQAGFEAWLVEAVCQSVTDLKGSGFRAEQLRTAGFTASECKEGGYDASELAGAGYGCAELYLAGMSASDCKLAGYSPEEQRTAGFSASEMAGAGCSNQTLKNAGYTAAEFKESGVSAATLGRLGFSVAELKTGGFSAKDINGGGTWGIQLLRDLKESGFSAKELKFSGVSATELKAIDFSCKELEAAGM